jgi:hypothetical protein
VLVRVLVPVLVPVLVAGLVAGLLAGCDSSGSSDAGSAPTSPAGTSASSGPASSSPSASASSDPASQALCAAITNAIGVGTKWQLDTPVPQTRVVSGVPVAACDVAESAGDPKTQLSAAFLPVGGSLDGAGRLAGLCQAVNGVPARAGDRSCATKPSKKPGSDLGRADLVVGDGGVLVLSFTTRQPTYAATAADDLGSVGTTLAADPLLARALGVAGNGQLGQ